MMARLAQSSRSAAFAAAVAQLRKSAKQHLNKKQENAPTCQNASSELRTAIASNSKQKSSNSSWVTSR